MSKCCFIQSVIDLLMFKCHTAKAYCCCTTAFVRFYKVNIDVRWVSLCLEKLWMVVFSYNVNLFFFSSAQLKPSTQKKAVISCIISQSQMFDASFTSITFVNAPLPYSFLMGKQFLHALVRIWVWKLTLNYMCWCLHLSICKDALERKWSNADRPSV